MRTHPKPFRHHRTNRAAFTLIEIVLVITIISILGARAMFVFINPFTVGFP